MTDAPYYEPGGYDDIAWHEPLVDYSSETLPARIDEILERAIDPKMVVPYNGEAYAVEDLPSRELRAMMGYGHHPDNMRRKEQFTRPDNLPWTYTPQTCLVAGQIKGVWIDAEHLACAGCGVDYT